MIRRRTGIIAFALALLAALSSYASIRITGLNSVSDREARDMIKDQVTLIETQGGSRPLADDASFFLERELRRQGYPEADVQWQFDEAKKNITLNVTEGRSQNLGEISISGNVAAVEEKDIRDLVRRATNNRSKSSAFSKPDHLPFVESDIASGLADVAQLYRSLGYWEAKTAPLENSRNSQNDIHVQIEAGPLHHFRGFTFTGDTGSDTAALQAILAPLVGQICTTDHVTKARNDVSTFYSQRGHYRHQIEVRPTDHSHDVTLNFAIDAGRAFRVAGLRIAGNERVHSGFLEKRFTSLVGKPYSPSEADKIYRELLSIGLFNTIHIRPEEIQGSDNDVDLAIDVEEAKSRSVGLYGGYGNYDGGILGLIFRENNVFGSGRQFKATAEYNKRGLLGKIEYSDKWFFNTPFFWDSQLFALTEEREGYEKFETGTRAEIGRAINDHYSVTAFATFGYTDITNAQIAAADLGLPNYRVGSIGLAHTYDTRNHPALPSRGFIFNNTLEYAAGPLGSEVDFLRGAIRLSTYIPIKRTQLSLGARSGFIMPTGDSDDLPIDLRFFSGGSTTVRSLREKYLGPTDAQGFPLGGQFYTTFNAEYSVPIFGGLKAAVFADAGNLLSDFDDASLDAMHYAAGAGLRYDLPTGPIRMDYGWNLNRGEREPSGTLHISVGFAF